MSVPVHIAWGEEAERFTYFVFTEVRVLLTSWATKKCFSMCFYIRMSLKVCALLFVPKSTSLEPKIKMTLHEGCRFP